MAIVNSRAFTEIENTYVTLKDGRRLAARLWLPENSELTPVPAVLEYLPYRKRDGTAPRDESNYPIFAQAGYAGVRVDISGTGESDGDFDDEYSPRELADGVEVIEWIASQPWCSGAVGMMGISWGGFNALQIAALNPPALKAVISIGSTVDRYNDDIHYKNGCLLYSNFWWSSVMLCYASRPPDPMLVGDGWRDAWLHRLRTQPFPLETWLSHQRRDDYWRHGSVCENYAQMTIPALVISGWADGYLNAPPAAAANFVATTKAINGPWIHKYPHFAYPHPRMDFHAEALRWWGQWLNGESNQADLLPDYRAYISEDVRPGTHREHEEGRWVAEQHWPRQYLTEKNMFPSSAGVLDVSAPTPSNLDICSSLDCGICAGEIFTLKPDAELAGDQRHDDADSLTFDTQPLSQGLEILGRPKLRLRVALDKPLGNLIARLVDVRPDGSGHRVSWGVLNLAHRKSNSEPEPMTPGKFEMVEILLDECGYRFVPGHRLRLSISTSYWPTIMPPPENVTATLALGGDTSLCLPVRPGGDSIDVPQPSDQCPLPEYEVLHSGDYQRWVEKDLQNRVTRFNAIGDEGESEVPGHGLRTRHRHQDCWAISLDDPLSTTSNSSYICWMSRGDWSIRTESESSLCCDATHYHIEARITAFEDDKVVNVREWSTSIPRDHM